MIDLDHVLASPLFRIEADGHMSWQFSRKDEFALRLAVQSGYNIAVLSGEELSPGLEEWLRSLGLNDLFFETIDRLDAYEEYVESRKMDSEGILYLGGELPDLEPMMKAGLPACPVDAGPEILGAAHYISPFKGGNGCVRDVLSKVLKLHHNWSVG